MHACTIGIDPSLNSTGVCVNSNGAKHYYIITGHMTKAMSSFKHKDIEYRPYEKQDTNKKLNTYNTVENHKSLNVMHICDEIERIVKQHPGCAVNMEGISYGSAGSAALADLAGLNFAIRLTLLKSGVQHIGIVTPGALKKFATANGSADKDLMVHSWLVCEPHLKEVTGIKVDDLADAYFLSCYDNVEA